MNYKAIIKKQSTIIAIAVICLTIATIGVSYALFFQVETNTNNQAVAAGTLNVEYGSGSSAIAATELIPMSDAEALSSSTMTGTIYIENTGTLPANYEVKIGNDTEAFNSRTDAAETDELLSHNYIRVAAYLDGTMVVEPITLNKLAKSESSTDLYKLFEGSIDTTGSGNSTATIVIKVWISEEAPETIIGDYVYLKMDITSKVMEGNLKSSVISHALENSYLYTETPNFSSVTADDEYGLFTAADDYGLSYYFRGDVENNFVQFGTYAEDTTLTVYDYKKWTEKTVEVKAGSPMYWRIVRINGDGSIRLIYDGTEKVANGVAHTATIQATAYNTNYDDAKYVGYTYDVDGTETNSTIKGVVDAWYDKHLKTTYGSYIADGIFCNDRQVTRSDEYGSTFYAPNYRLSGNNKTPVLTCTNKEDRYTTSTEIGNGKLTDAEGNARPIGLLTADEAFMAGGTTASNMTYYLYSGEKYWTSAPHSFSYYALVWSVGDDGDVYDSDAYLGAGGARPVINLKADIEFVGDGSINSPYKIKELAK